MGEHFKVDLRGIIDLAANHLYSSADVFVRELIQNAVDAITARKRREPDLAGCVRLELTPAGDQPARICAVDNGIGLTVDEVHEFLSTVGASSKRDAAGGDEARIAETEDTFLGRFGIGLLSCFMVSDEIVVVTRSATAPAAAVVEWRGRSDGSYAVRELSGNSAPIGTAVYLTCKPDLEEYFEFDRLGELARKFGEMLATPIVVAHSGQESPINAETRPWDISLSDEVAIDDMCQQRLGFRALDAFAISTTTGGVSGHAFITSERTSGWGAARRLYSRGMFVQEGLHDLFPRWANFIGCVLNTSGLPLTASREDVREGEALAELREELAQIVRDRLVHLLRRDRARFEAVMHVHDVDIRGYATKDRDFFAAIIDLLEFQTTLGPIRFGEFRREHERLLMARTAEQFRRISPIAAAAGLRVFNGGYTYHEELLAQAVGQFPELALATFDSADLAEMLIAPDDSAPFEALCAAGDDALAAQACTVVVREFGPDYIPAFFALGMDAEYHRSLDQVKAMSAGIWQEVLDTMAPRPEAPAPTRLCLNARCGLVRQVATQADPAVYRSVIEVLYVQALMAGQHALTGEDMSMLSRGMETLLKLVAARDARR